MKAVVVYESVWGNTKAIAEAVAMGRGSGARCLSTLDATPERLGDPELIVAGAPMQMFNLPTEGARSSIDPDELPTPELSGPTMRSWLEGLPAGHGRCAAFDTKIGWSPGSAANVIGNKLTEHGYRPLAEPQHFVVGSKVGPLRSGELERAERWGEHLGMLARDGA